MRGATFLRRQWRWLVPVAVGLICLAVFQVSLARGWRASDRVILPNGLIIMRASGQGAAADLFAKDGESRLARELEFVCFNDRYVWVYSYDRKETGLFDAETQARVDGLGLIEALSVSGLGGSNQACNGYYSAMVGPGLLYDGNTSPHLPACSQRNMGNTTLQDRSWFDRPCEERQ
jgi:hypothetical protein